MNTTCASHRRVVGVNIWPEMSRLEHIHRFNCHGEPQASPWNAAYPEWPGFLGAIGNRLVLIDGGDVWIGEMLEN